MKSFFKYRRAHAIFTKEFKHIFRDPFTLMMALLLPFLIVLILGNSIEFNIKSIDLAYIDHDKTQSSRKLIETFGSSNYFLPYEVQTPEQAFQNVVNEKARAVLIIPPQFEKQVLGQGKGDVQILLDGADNSSIAAIMNYLTTINTNAIYKIKDVPRQNSAPLSFKTRYLFNPELNSRWFAVPGIAAVIIALVSIMLTALTVCREWEKGSMEMLLSTPATSLEIMFGKLFPYAFLSFAGFVIVFLAARFIFDVPFVGAYWILALGTIIFIFDYLALGLYISIVSHEQQVAVQYAAIIGLLPTALLSGFLFPVEYMPTFYQWLSSVFPARFYVDITRDQFLKASTFADLWLPFTAMFIQGSVLIAACLWRFKRTLE